jgi:hypothetical protein
MTTLEDWPLHSPLRPQHTSHEKIGLGIRSKPPNFIGSNKDFVPYPTKLYRFQQKNRVHTSTNPIVCFCLVFLMCSTLNCINF